MIKLVFLLESAMLPRNFSWLDKSKVAGSGRPETESDLQDIKKEGVTAIISLTGTPLNPDVVRGLGFEYLHSHISGQPSMRQLDEIIRFIEQQNSSSSRVLVHCAEGMGRTGTVLAAYLVAQGFGADEAIKRVREKRPGSIQTPEQENVIREFEKAVRARKSEIA